MSTRGVPVEPHDTVRIGGELRAPASSLLALALGPVRDDRRSAACVEASVEAMDRVAELWRARGGGPCVPRLVGDRPPHPPTQLARWLAAWRHARGDVRVAFVTEVTRGGEPAVSAARDLLDAGLPLIVDVPMSPAQIASFKNGVFPQSADVHGVTFGRHCIVLVGCCDALLSVTDPLSGEPVRAAFRVRNNWGAGWGDHGYGWLPHAVVAHGLVRDAWCVAPAPPPDFESTDADAGPDGI